MLTRRRASLLAALFLSTAILGLAACAGNRNGGQARGVPPLPVHPRPWPIIRRRRVGPRHRRRLGGKRARGRRGKRGRRRGRRGRRAGRRRR